jgi:hypothetical protein
MIQFFSYHLGKKSQKMITKIIKAISKIELIQVVYE